MHPPLDRMKIRAKQFGRVDPLSNTFGKVRNHGTRVHQGWDIEASPGTPVYAIADGKLTHSHGKDYGECLQLEFTQEGKTYYAFYAHLGLILMKSCSVTEGSVVAFTGMSGNASGIPKAEAHLHFEIRTKSAAGKGLGGRIDPGEILGYKYYGCYQ